MKNTYASKQGKHGTLFLFECTYDMPFDSCVPTQKTRLWRYSAEHVHDAWFDTFAGYDGGADAPRLLSTRKVKVSEVA